jgi:tetratricopeptide (TPR) repeat protein
MGWFYRVQFEDYAKAEKHYKAALRYSPQYPHAHWNYAFMLMDLERYEELDKLLDKAMSIPSLNKAMVYNQRAEMREVQGAFAEAMLLYKEAIKRSVKNDQIEAYWESIERCQEKLALDMPDEGMLDREGLPREPRERGGRLRFRREAEDGPEDRHSAPGLGRDAGPGGSKLGDWGFDGESPFDDLFDDEPGGGQGPRTGQ